MAEGSPEPLGVHLSGGGANVSIPAPGADALEFCEALGPGLLTLALQPCRQAERAQTVVVLTLDPMAGGRGAWPTT